MDRKVPVYRSFIIPFEGEYVREVIGEDRRFWEELIKVDLREFLKLSLNIAKMSNGGLERAEKLELVADLMTFFFRAPLTMDPLLSLAPSPPKLYLALRLRKRFLESFCRDPMDYLHTLVEWVDASLHINEELRRKISRAWLIFPADTRPGANASSLIAHLLTTPSIAWSLAYNSTKDREYLAVLRISSQLHDVAKPIEAREHYRAAVFGDLVDSLLREILDDEEINEIKDAVKQHHVDESSPIRRADQISAAIDRVREVVKNLIGNDLTTPEFREIASRYQKDVFELAYGGGKDSWDFWATVEDRMPGKIRELSEKFVKRLSEVPRIQVESRPLDDLRYFLIDIGGVQQFVYRSPKLRAVAAASLFIDYLTSFMLPLFIQAWLEREKDMWMPLESFLLTSGANVAGILPRGIEEDILWEVVEELRERLGPLKVDFNVVVAPFHQYYPRMWDEVNREMALKKSVPRPLKNGSDIFDGINPSKLCELCYREKREEAILKTNIGDLCATCSKLLELGEKLGSKAKWERGFELGRERIVPKNIWGVEYNDEYGPDSIALNVIELISGMDPPFRGRELNVGIIKGDGNRMGEFFSKSISISDALERSFRVDQSLKTAYNRALCAILSAGSTDENARRKDVCRIWLGTIYMSGDDFLIISPSWLSLPLSYILVKEFESSMGGKCTMSIGVAVVPPKHSVWHGIRAADEMMEIAKREVGRKYSTSAIFFDVVEQGLLSEGVVLRRLELQRSNGLTSRPMPVESESGFSVKRLLCFFGYPLDNYDPNRIMMYAYNHRPSEDAQESPALSRLRLTRRAVREAIESVRSMLGGWNEKNRVAALPMVALYCFRESNDSSREEEFRNVFKEIGELCVSMLTAPIVKGERVAPLLDLDIGAKILGGGKI